MRQALLNVLTAAIRANPGGQIRVSAQTCGQEVSLLIQAASPATPAMPVPDGKADSLEIARQLVGLSGGSLEVLASAGSESAFAAKLAFPIADQAAVLVIDDNVDTLQLFQRYLAGTRYPFIGIREPEQALALAKQLAPRMIVLDVMLPGIDGWELLGRLREHPKTRDVPVVVCTILPQEELALSLGAAEFLPKPVSRDALLAALDRHLGQQSPGSS